MWNVLYFVISFRNNTQINVDRADYLSLEIAIILDTKTPLPISNYLLLKLGCSEKWLFVVVWDTEQLKRYTANRPQALRPNGRMSRMDVGTSDTMGQMFLGRIRRWAEWYNGPNGRWAVWMLDWIVALLHTKEMQRNSQELHIIC